MSGKLDITNWDIGNIYDLSGFIRNVTDETSSKKI